ncbi:MAG: hypothetical protein WB975_07280 [Nitrososphaeraceae archaeon]
MDLHPTTRALLEQIIDNEISQIQFVVSAIRNDERFWTTTVKNEENYVLGFVMGKIMSSSSSMFIAMHNRMGTLGEINQILQVIHTSGEEITSAYTNCREDTKIKN